VWSHSGSAAEGLSAYTQGGLLASFVPDHLLVAQNALLLPSGSNATARGVPSLPTNNQARSVVVRVAVPSANGTGCITPLLTMGSSLVGSNETFNVAVQGAPVGSPPTLVAYSAVGAANRTPPNSISGACAATSSPVLPLVWYSLALTYDGSSTRAYVNGVLVSTTTPPAAFATPSTKGYVTLGSSAAGNNMALAFSDARLYGRALTVSEVASLASPAFPSFPNAVNAPVPFTGSAFTFFCSPGFFGDGPPMTLTLNNTDNTWVRSGASTVNCTACPSPSQYSFGGSGCGTCPSSAGWTVKSDRSGCVPPTGPTDAVVAVSGAQEEGIDAFLVGTRASVTYTSDRLGAASSALQLALGAQLTTPPLPTLPAGSSARSLTFWMKAAAAATNVTVAEMSASPSSGGSTSARFGVGSRSASSATALLLGGAASDLVIAGGSSNIRDGRWHMVAAVYDGTSASLFVDGVFAGSAASRLLATPSSPPLRLGWNGDAGVGGGEQYVGALADVRVYPRALTAAELTALILPPLPTYVNTVLSPTAALGVTAYSWSCSPGFFGPTMTLTLNNTDNTWVRGGATTMNCSACAAGSYSVAGSTTTCSACPAGSFGSTTAMASASCSGQCDAGYTCPAGSTSPRVQACGGVGVFCPLGSATPTSVSAGFYSTPLGVAKSVRTSQTACPTNRQCAGGSLLPPVDLSATCPGGELVVQVTEEMRNVDIGPVLEAAAPGWTSSTPNVRFNVSSISPVQLASTCPVSTYVIFPVQPASNSSRLRIGSTALSAEQCGTGIAVVLRAFRFPASGDDALVTDAIYQDTCKVTIFPGKTLAAPNITLCASMSGGITVQERLAPGTSYGPVVTATLSTSSAALIYRVVSSVSSPTAGVALPFGVDCSGNLFSSRLAYAAVTSSFNVSIAADAVGFGETLTSTCNFTIRVIPKPLVPTLTTILFTVTDDATVGAVAGDIGPVSSNSIPGLVNYTATTTFSVLDSPDAFAVSSAGRVTTKLALDATQKSLYVYTVSVTDGLASTTYPIQIAVLPAPRAPVTFAQSRSVSDSAVAGVALTPALDATQSQGSALTFTIVDSTNTFGIFGNGTLYLLTGAPALDVNLVPTYSLTFTVTAANGRTAVSTVTITVLETNKAPVFAAPAAYNRTVDEGTAAGTAFDLPITATDSNRRDTLTYTITACNPFGTNGTLCPFDLDAATGRLRVAPTSAGAIFADRSATFPGSSPFTYSLRITATDNGSPQRTANASVFVQVARVRPRLTSPPSSPLLLLANASAGTALVDMSARAWTAYSTSSLAYSIVNPQPATAEGDVAFVIGSLTGVISVRSPAPAWNFNTRRAFSFAVLVNDTLTGLTAQAQVDVSLLHVNRAPSVSSVPTTDVPARSRGNILSLASYVSDADVGLAGISEAFTYSLIAGNTDNTFTLSSSTGQLSVLNASTPSFVFNAGTGTGTVYNLTARVCDAGIDGPSLCALANISLRVVAGSIPPAVSDTAFAVKENSAAGTSVGTVSARDEQGYALTYSITGGNSEGLFSIGTTTGQITVTSPIPLGADLDFETRSSYSLVVSVRNAAPTPASATATITVTVLDVNEAPTTPATSVRAVDENSPAGTLVGLALTASDVDARDQGLGQLTFTLLTTGSPFALDPVSGQLSVASATLDYEVVGGYTLSYRVSDSAWEAPRGNLTADGSVFVDVNNRNDQPLLADISASVDENGAGLTVATLRAVEQDAGQGFVYALSRTASACWAYSITAAQATSFSSGGGAGVAVVPVALPAVSAGALQTVVFRFRGSGSVRLVLSATATLSTSDRYEITYTRTSTEVKRIFASGSTTTVLTTAQSLLPTSTTAWVHLAVTIDRTGKRLLLGTRPSNDPSAAVTTQMTLDESASTQLTIARVGVTGSVSGAVVSSVCFDSALTSSFAVDSSSGAVTTAVALDFETQAQYGVEVMVTDSTAGNNLLPANLVDYAVVVVAVTNKNEVPVWPAPVTCAGATLSTASYLACLSISENAAVNAVPAGLVPSPTDPDAGQTFVYTSQLDGNAASGARVFDINSLSRVVTLRQSVLNFETTSGYTVRLTATDSGAPTPQLSASGDIWIAVLDVNEPPVLLAATRTANEGDLPGTFVGLPVVGSDPDVFSVPFSTLNYTIVGGDGQATFNISSSTGQIALAAGAVLDFELKSTYSLTVRTTDGGGLFAEATITINVLNVNERPGLFGPWTRQISEAAVAPASVGVPVNASDPDRGTQLSFAVIGGNGTGIFDVNRCSGQITLLLGASLDFETARVYALTIRVSDDGVPSLSDTQTYVVSVLDANDAPALTDQTRTVPEIAAAGTAVGSPVTWSDPDTFASTALAWFTPTFSIVAGNDRSVFQINSTTGQLSVAAGGGALLDFEDSNANRYNVLVRVTDGGGLSAQGTVQVQVTDVNEAPFFTDASLARSIDENCPRSTRAAGDNVGSPILANDRDAGQASTLSFSITGGNALGYFSVVATGASRGQIQVTATGASALDFETAPRYNLSVTVTDSGALTATSVVAVSLINRNEAPVVTASISRSVSEDAALFSLVGGPITATDPEDSTGLRYSITAGNDVGVFRIDPATGQISVASTASLNFETIPSFSLTVLVTDTGAPEGATAVLSTPTTVVITVLDVNERPVLLPAATITAPENLASASLVGLLGQFVSDPDQVDTRAFSILSQENTTSNQAPFALNASGALVVAPGTPLLDFERKSLYTLVVEVRDKGGLAANATVQVRLRNVNEPPVWQAVPVLFARALELQDVGQALVALVRDQDLDIAATNERLTFALVGGNTDSIFAVHPSSGQISVVNNNSLTYPTGAPTGPEYNLTVQVTDAGVDGSAISSTVFVTVRTVDNNRRPTLVPYTFFLDENAPPGTEIGRVFAADVDSVSGQTVSYTLDAAGSNINRPFPFNITTLRNAGTGNVGVGILSVTWDGAAGSLPWANLDFEAPAKQSVVGGVGFSTYTTTVTATDSHPSRLSATASVVIVLRDVPEAPSFSPSRVASSATFWLTVAENSPAGTSVSIVSALSSRAANAFGGLWALDDDIVDAGQNLTYAWSAGTPSAVSSLFSLDARTGAVTVSAAGSVAGALDFESARRTQSLTVVATDTTGRTDSATVSVALSDENEPQTWNGTTGIFTPAWTMATRLSVFESSAPGTVIGRISAVDVDSGAAGVLVYSLMANAEADPFSINPATGVLSVAGYGLDFEDKDTWFPTVLVSDSAPAGSSFTISRVVTVDVQDVNDATITDVQLDAGEEAPEVAETVVAGVSAHGATHAGMTSLFRTRGGVRVRIAGVNLGLTSARLARLGFSTTPATLAVTYGPVGTEYTATSCSITANATAITCTSAPGSGVNHVWRVVLTTFVARAVPSFALSTALTGYLPPTLKNASLITSAGPLDAAGNAMPTDGSAVIRVTGANFGPASSTVILRYGPAPALVPPGGLAAVPLPYATVRCSPEVEHDSVLCRSVPGVGGLPFLFRVAVDVSALQVSPPLDTSLVRYMPPSITGVTGPVLNTRGGETFAVQGTNLGPVGTPAQVVYSTSWSADGSTSDPTTTFTASGCAVTVAHTAAACISSPAVGAGHRLRITVAGQSSDVSLPSVSLAYRAPRITAISGQGSSKAATEGGQSVLLTGDFFGPTTPATLDGIPLPTALVPAVRYGRTGTNASAAFAATFPASSLRYAAVNCRVTSDHTQVTCTTAPGTGKDLRWELTIADQSTGIFLGGTSNYAAPVVAQYTGAGASSALTSGGEEVLIDGFNFGPVGSPLDSATYGQDGRDFSASSCSIVTPHTRLRCLTSVGAGAALRWIVTVDGQESSTPTTDYGVPVILSVSGPGAVDASTDGGDVVVLTGTYFATDEFLESVTYGPGGTEYDATGCAVTANHTQITCRTVPGTGRKLRWTVTVRGQTSSPSSQTTSYAAPTIVAIAPATGKTDGGITVALQGSNFGLAAPASRFDIRVNALGSPMPASADVAAYWASVRAGDVGLPSVAAWIAGLVRPYETSRSIMSRGNHTVEFTLPEGFGVGREVFLVVDGVPSNVVTFAYDAPAIFNVAPDRLGVPIGYLRVFVEGINFCRPTPAAPNCGSVLVDGVAVLPNSHGHERIMLVVQDPASTNTDVRITVVVDGVASNVVPFSKPVPSFDAITGQGSWGGGQASVVSSASVSLLLTLSGPGIDTATLLQPTVGGPFRRAVATSAGIAVSAVRLSNLTSLATGIMTPVGLLDIVNAAGAGGGRRARQLQPATGVNITTVLDLIAAFNAGNSTTLQPSAADLAALANTVIARLQSGSLSSAILQAVATSLGVSPSALTAALVPSSLVQSIVTSTVSTGGGLSTAGGEAFYIGGITSIATVDPADVKILIGGRLCTNLTKTVDGDLAAQYGVPPDSPLAIQYRTYRLDCLTPPGAGKDLPIVVTVPGGQSQANPDFVFSYAPPTITDVVDASFSSTSYLSATVRGIPNNGIPTVGAQLELRGADFGAADVPNLAAAAQVRITLASTSPDLTARRVFVVPVSSWTHTSLRFTMPAGYGTLVDLTLLVGGQSSADVSVGSAAAPSPTLVRYSAPTVASVSPQLQPTTGGTLLAVVGSNFGSATGASTVPAGLPVITVNGKPCAVPTTYVPTAAHDQLTCILPEGQGASVPVVVTVAGQAAAVPATYTYARPQVRSVSPSSGPTSGRRLDGAQINVTLVGTDLGLVGSVEFRPAIASENLPVVIVPSSSLLVHNHTHMVFPMPEGAGSLLTVHAVIGGQDSAELVPFVYDPPSVVDLVRGGSTAAQCAPRLEEIGYGNGSVISRLGPAGCYPTRGGYQLLITGESFGLGTPRVTLGGRPCDVQSSGHNQIVVTVPPGLGDFNPVVVTVGGRSSPVFPAAVFAYDPPVVRAFVPNVPQVDFFSEPGSAPRLVLGEIEVRGFNFGADPTPLSILIGGLSCLTQSWKSDNLLACRPDADTVGPKNVSILVANRSTPFVWLEEENLVELRCKKGLNGLRGEVCVDCTAEVRGANCPGGEMDVDLVVSQTGWWRTDVAAPSDLCHPLRQSRARCPTFLPCEPAESCLGANVCADAYTGERCSECIKGSYYRVNGECIRCPNNPWAVVVIFVLGALVALMVAYTLNRKKVNLALISIGIDYFQIVAMFARTRIRWPALVKQLFLILSAFNFNLEIIAPECAIPEVTFAGKWLFIEGLPLFGWLILALIGGTQYAYRRAFLNKKGPRRTSHIPSLIGTGIVVLRVLYIYITRTTFDVFNCAPTSPPDGKEYMAWNLNIVCNEPGGTHLFLLPFAVAALIVYVAGAPLLALWFLRKNRMAVKYDQILRAMGKGDDRFTNPSFYTFRKTWHKLYYHFVPGKWYWEGVITARKFFIAFTSLMFRQAPSYQLAIALLVLFVAYVLHMRHLPYLTHDSSRRTVAEHIQKASEGTGIHAAIEKVMRAVEIRNAGRTGTTRNGMGGGAGGNGNRVGAASAGEARRRLLQGMAASYPLMRAFDYNTVEAIMLASAILINLAGIMFDSARFQGENLKYYQAEYDSLAYAIIVLIFLSIIYWAATLAFDIFAVASPASADRFFGIITARSTEAATRFRKAAGDRLKRAGLRSGSSSSSSAAAGFGAGIGDAGSSSFSDPTMSSFSSNTVELVFNPLLNSTTKTAIKGASAASAGLVAEIGRLEGPPDEARWRRIRDFFLAEHAEAEAARAAVAAREHGGESVRGSLDSILGMATAPDTSQWLLIRDIVRQLHGRNVELLTELKTAVRDRSEAQLEAELEKSAVAKGRRPEKAAPPGAVEVGPEGPAVAGALGVYRPPSASSKSFKSLLGAAPGRSPPTPTGGGAPAGFGRSNFFSLKSVRGGGGGGGGSGLAPGPAPPAAADDGDETFAVAGLRDTTATAAGKVRAVFSPQAADATKVESGPASAPTPPSIPPTPMPPSSSSSSTSTE
jgi:VCBS repeat-containing protein